MINELKETEIWDVDLIAKKKHGKSLTEEYFIDRRIHHGLKILITNECYGLAYFQGWMIMKKLILT